MCVCVLIVILTARRPLRPTTPTPTDTPCPPFPPPKKKITANEPQFTGHFPERPIMPGVLMVEAMAQLSGVLCLQAPVSDGKGLFFFAGGWMLCFGLRGGYLVVSAPAVLTDPPPTRPFSLKRQASTASSSASPSSPGTRS